MRRVSKSCWSRRSTCASASCKTSSGKSSTIKPDGQRIVAKMNQVEDLVLARALSAALQAGVPVDLIVRVLFGARAPG